MARVAAAWCGPRVLRLCVVEGAANDPQVLEETEHEVPAARRDRGEQLRWVRDTAADALGRLSPERLWLRRAEGQRALDPERHEVEGVLQLVCAELGIVTEMRTKDQVRKAFGIARGPGAFDGVLALDAVRARSNADRRLLFAYAWGALRDIDAV